MFVCKILCFFCCFYCFKTHLVITSYKDHFERIGKLNLHELKPNDSLKCLRIDWPCATTFVSNYSYKYAKFKSDTFFQSLTHLARLFLKNADFSDVTSGAFKSLVSLQVLDLTGAKNSSHIDLECLPRLKWLRLLVVDNDVPNVLCNRNLQVLEYKYQRFVKNGM